MSERADIEAKEPRLVYSCRCGWLDLGHMDSKSYRPNEGAQSLWDQLSSESGEKSRDKSGFKLQYQQTHAKKKFKITVRDGVYGTYWVKYGLSTSQKESVALAIFKEISTGFETMQSSWFYSRVTDSGFSAEDLVSNLLGFYKVLRPDLDIKKICGVVGKQPSLNVWDTYGAVGEHKNQSFVPLLFVLPMNGTHTHQKHTVTIEKDGKLVVKKGDTLSGYSAAMYQGDASHISEFGRLANGAVQKVSDPNSIKVGETLYHIPTYKVAKGAVDRKGQQGTMPEGLPEIAIIGKGDLYRDWTSKD